MRCYQLGACDVVSAIRGLASVRVEQRATKGHAGLVPWITCTPTLRRCATVPRWCPVSDTAAAAD